MGHGKDKHPIPRAGGVFVGQNAGFREGRPKPKSPLEAYKLFMTPEVVQHIANCTNERARSFIGANTKRKINGLIWRPVTIDDIYTYLALVKIMGILE